MPQTTFKFGDRLIHTHKPEWGSGVVSAVQAVEEAGVHCQRVTVRFDRAGLKTLTTNIAELELVTEDTHPAAPVSGNQPDTWLTKLENGTVEELMSRLPEPARDPFNTLQSRIEATLKLYRFSEHGGALIDWAAAQTGLKDPMTRFNRHELEALFKRFALERDTHLKTLVIEGRRKDPNTTEKLLTSGPASARDALRRLNAR
ncbi:MAG: DUF3553 domain-containing protein [Phycisphaerales bacterium]